MSKYHLMHKFKSQTGYTIHSYILQKRLMMANTLIKSGRSITEACTECGFGDYSSFVRAFKKMYGQSPKKHHKTAEGLEKLEQ
jgi:AraC-like DNA-binding protein